MLSISHTLRFLIVENCAVAALVIMINGYVMLSFFLSKVNGLLFGFVACLGASAYVAFLVYLISQRHNHAELNGFTHLTN